MPPDPNPAVIEAMPAAARGGTDRGGTPPIGEEFAPFGRLVKCQLVDTVDSVTARSEPIVALVTEDLDWNGGRHRRRRSGAAGRQRRMDPRASRRPRRGQRAGAHPEGEGDRPPRDRRGRTGPRPLVGAGGRSRWACRLHAVDARQQGDQAFRRGRDQRHGAGIRGDRPTPGGRPGTAGSPAARIRDEISKRGVYVRVPAGKAFYLFVEQTIDPRAAAVGLRLPPARSPSR